MGDGLKSQGVGESPDVIRSDFVDRDHRPVERSLTGFRHLARAGSDPMMARRLPRRAQAIRLVIRTGCIPGRNATWSEFCNLVRMAARVAPTAEGFPRGWSDSSIVNSAREITSGPAMLCERCKTEIALANALDAEPDVNRRRRALLVRGERRVLPLPTWALFEALYAGRGYRLSGDFLRRAIGAPTLGQYVGQLRRALSGSRYRVVAHRDDEYELTVAQC
jgi:hypothetical protein